MKILIVVLIVIAVLFVVLMVWGAGNNSSQSATDAKSFKPTSMLTGLNGLLAPFAPKVASTQFQPALATCNLQSKQTCAITIAADSSHTFRQAAFKVQPAKCADVLYQSSPGDASSGLPGKQDSSDAKDPSAFTFTVLKGGGALTITRISPSNAGLCQVSLQ